MSDNQELHPVNTKRKKQSSKIVGHSLVRESYLFSGPIPHPALLNKYDPSTRKIIVTMARDQSRHRQQIEAAVIKSNIRNEQLGIFVAALSHSSL